MTPKFSKALLAAGLAAALVGCGGGSSTTTMNGSGSMTEPTAAETAAKQVDASYTTAKSLVDALSPTSGDVQKKAAQDAVNDLRNLISTTVDLSDAKRTTSLSNVNTLFASITTKTISPKTTPPAQPTEPEVRNTAWYNKLSRDSLDKLSKAWPDSNTLSGKKTPVTGLPAGWEGMDYSYSNTTTTASTDEQGKTFKKEVVKPTPEIELTWEQVAREAAKTNRSSLINDYLGGPGLMFEIVEGGSPAQAGGGADTNLGTGAATVDLRRVITTIPATVSLGGTGIVYQQQKGKAIAEAAGEGVTAFTENEGKNVITTSFHKRDFTKMDANAVVNLPGATTGGWNIDASFVNFGASPQYVMWKGIPGIMTYVDDSSGTSEVRVRFNPTTGFLEYVPAGGVLAAGERTMMSFVPISTSPLLDSAQVHPNLATQNIHTRLLTVRPEGTKTSVMEFAYWASQNKSSPFTVNVSTFVRQHPNMMFDAVTDMPDKLTGMAKYNGLAAGYYAIGKESNGEFTADAMLTANFGTNTVSGMVDGFDSMTNDDDLSPWKLTLSAATFMDDGTFGNAFDGTTSGQSDGGGQQGKWNGQFLGKANPGTDLESAADMTNDYPEAVVGNFTGHFAANDGHVEGAFGTELHDDYKE